MNTEQKLEQILSLISDIKSEIQPYSEEQKTCFACKLNHRIHWKEHTVFKTLQSVWNKLDNIRFDIQNGDYTPQFEVDEVPEKRRIQQALILQREREQKNAKKENSGCYCVDCLIEVPETLFEMREGRCVLCDSVRMNQPTYQQAQSRDPYDSVGGDLGEIQSDDWTEEI